MATLKSQILIRNDTANNWIIINPILGKGEIGIEIDTRKFKIGDGATYWNDLKYANAGAGIVGDQTRQPVSSDTDYDLGSIWFNSADGTVWILSAMSALGDEATWVELPVATNVTAGTYTKVTVNSEGLVTAGQVQIALSDVSDAGTAANKDVGIEAGNVPVLDENGKLDTSVIPSLAIGETFVVASESEMLAVSAQCGDIAIRTDENKTYILSGSDPTVLSNWTQLLFPEDAVSSVNGKNGDVVLTTDDVAEGGANLYYTDARATTNFNTNYKASSVKDLADGADVCMDTDTFTLDCGDAEGW